jgi:7-keto-8-aminopelargonate synthetase-like enzyme
MSRSLTNTPTSRNPAIPPGVPDGRDLIRTSVNPDHAPEQVGRLIEAFAVVGKRRDVIG